jgi:hypothetical protein
MMNFFAYITGFFMKFELLPILLTLKQQWTIKISSPLFSILSLAAILVGSRDHRTQFWKGAIQESFQQSLPGWVPFKFVSESPALHSRWPLLLKIEISSNGQNCSILSQNVPKFQLCKHKKNFTAKPGIYVKLFLAM